MLLWPPWPFFCALVDFPLLQPYFTVFYLNPMYDHRIIDLARAESNLEVRRLGALQTTKFSVISAKSGQNFYSGFSGLPLHTIIHAQCDYRLGKQRIIGYKKKVMYYGRQSD
jgi:hypothetical protein